MHRKRMKGVEDSRNGKEKKWDSDRNKLETKDGTRIEVTGEEWSWKEDGRVIGEHGSMTIEQSGKGWKLEEDKRVVGKDGTWTRVEGSGKGWKWDEDRKWESVEKEAHLAPWHTCWPILGGGENIRTI